LRTRLLNLLTPLTSTLLCLVAVECFSALLNRRAVPIITDPAEATGPGTEPSRFSAYHPLLGHDGRPNIAARSAAGRHPGRFAGVGAMASTTTRRSRRGYEEQLDRRSPDRFAVVNRDERLRLLADTLLGEHGP
jgi:hypothetical protein